MMNTLVIFLINAKRFLIVKMMNISQHFLKSVNLSQTVVKDNILKNQYSNVQKSHNVMKENTSLKAKKIAKIFQCVEKENSLNFQLKNVKEFLFVQAIITSTLLQNNVNKSLIVGLKNTLITQSSFV